MPRLTRVFIKAGLLYFLGALVMGVLMAAPDLLGLSPTVLALRPVYFHLFMVGWVTQLIIGVALWMFPKYSRELPRGHEPLGWLSFWMLNVGLLLRAVGEPALVWQREVDLGWLLALSALLQLAGGWAFIANIWPRVKER
jgi:heme/copper-type cytochrome/quinol oxidase subunit 1